MDARSLYSEIILDLAKNPPNYGCSASCPIHFSGGNPTCGDAVSVCLRFTGDTIAEVRFESDGCVISKAGAACMTELATGKTAAEVLAIEPESLFGDLGPIVKTRTRCALLGLHILKEGLRKHLQSGEKTIQGISI